MSYVQKIGILSKTKIVAMSEQVKNEVMTLTERLINLKKMVAELNHADETELKEIQQLLHNNQNYQKAANELLDFLKMTMQGSNWFGKE